MSIDGSMRYKEAVQYVLTALKTMRRNGEGRKKRSGSGWRVEEQGGRSEGEGRDEENE